MEKLENIRKLLKTKKKMASRRPKFVKSESWRYKRVSPNWSRPRGLDNRIRRRIKGWPASPNVGYRSPRLTRYIHPSGLEEIMVYNVGDLTIIDPATQIARIGGTVGAKKRILIVEEALKRNIKILNPGKGSLVSELKETESQKKEEQVEGEEGKKGESVSSSVEDKAKTDTSGEKKGGDSQ
ncbi:50S ribosomal protein L32e [Candidatus Bathyarchaeota archaeon]|nr:50S ribosomal protein L32e [Candidatus Bathyarchaeota archaeon]